MMNGRARILFTIILAAMMTGQAFPAGRPAAVKPDAEKLADLLLANSFREADRLATRLLGKPALAPDEAAICGLAVLKAGRPGEAEVILKQALQRSPDEPDAHLGLGRIAFARNDSGAAIAHLRRGVASAFFYEEALRLLWRAVLDRGRSDELLEIAGLAGERFRRESKPLPPFFNGGLAQAGGPARKQLFQMAGRFERLRLPLAACEQYPGIRMISLALNGKGDRLFHIDSALPGFMTITPLLAAELGLAPGGSATSAGVGTAQIATRFAVLDTVALGPITFHNVSVMVADIATLRGRREGLVGAAFLKRFNVTIDMEGGTMDLFPLDRPDLLAGNIDRAAVAADIPLLAFDQTVVEASVAGAPPALYILDTAASNHLVDSAFFAEHIEPTLDPGRIIQAKIRGAGGTQVVRHVQGLPIALGSLVLAGQQVSEFPMAGLNALSGRYAAGLLGNCLLRPFRVHMDFRAGRLILERSPRSAKSDGN
jgi:hypothetical protein